MFGLVSIITPSYNTGDLISETINSVLNQVYQNWELIIIDDCSSDNTNEVIMKFNDSRIKFFRNQRNQGAATSRNIALKMAKGKWIAFLDSDDIWLPNKLKRQLEFMVYNNYCFSYTKYSHINYDGRDLGVVISGPKVIGKTGMRNYCWPGCLTVMYNADLVGLIQIEKLKRNNDYAMWLKISKDYNCYFLDEHLAKYRYRRNGSISSQNIFKLLYWHYKLFRISEEMSIFKSLFNTLRNAVFSLYKKGKYVQKN